MFSFFSPTNSVLENSISFVNLISFNVWHCWHCFDRLLTIMLLPQFVIAVTEKKNHPFQLTFEYFDELIWDFLQCFVQHQKSVFQELFCHPLCFIKWSIPFPFKELRRFFREHFGNKNRTFTETATDCMYFLLEHFFFWGFHFILLNIYD